MQIKHLSIDCGNDTFPGAFVRGINGILIRKSYFSVQKGLLNKYILAEKLRNNIPTSYRMPNGYFQEERF